VNRRATLPIVTVAALVGASSLFVGEAESAASPTPRFNFAHDCTFCHTTHTAPGPSLTIATDVEVLCLTCHGPAGTSPLKAAVHTNDNNSNYDPFRITCTDCHDPHDGQSNWLGGVNIENVGPKDDATWLAKIPTPSRGLQDVVFESRGDDAGEPTLHSFADDDEDGNGVRDGVCEVCHTQTKHHRYDISSGHHTGETCTRCHAHVDGFMK